VGFPIIYWKTTCVFFSYVCHTSYFLTWLEVTSGVIMTNTEIFHIFHIISLFNLSFFHIFHIISLFNLLYFHIFHTFSLFNLLFIHISHIKMYYYYGQYFVIDIRHTIYGSIIGMSLCGFSHNKLKNYVCFFQLCVLVKGDIYYHTSYFLTWPEVTSQEVTSFPPALFSYYSSTFWYGKYGWKVSWIGLISRTKYWPRLFAFSLLVIRFYYLKFKIYWLM
jgi:hypothetical protein